MSILNQLRHDLTYKARLSLPEVDTLLAHPELAVEAAAPTPTQAALRSILRQSVEAASLQAAVGTFERDLNRPAGHDVEPPTPAEAATDVESTQLLSSTDSSTDGLVDPPTGGDGD
jgi:hypothetical protein